MTVQFYAVGSTISEDSEKFVTKSLIPVIGNIVSNSVEITLGEGLAPDRGVSATDTETDTLQSGASPLPPVDLHWVLDLQWAG